MEETAAGLIDRVHLTRGDTAPRAKTSGKKRGRAKAGKRRSKTRSKQVTVPVDIGVGPLAVVPNAPIFLDQPAFLGAAISVAAVIDQKLLRQHKNKIPKQYRKQLRGIKTIYYRPLPLLLIPELLIVSPALLNTGMYGAVWRPIGIGLPFELGPTTLVAGARLDLSYIFIHSSTLPSPTHFVRPGINLHLTYQIPVADSLLFSLGWSSDFYLPQPVGRPPWEFWPLDDALWHLGGPFIKLHLRFPYSTTL